MHMLFQGCQEPLYLPGNLYKISSNILNKISSGWPIKNLLLQQSTSNSLLDITMKEIFHSLNGENIFPPKSTTQCWHSFLIDNPYGHSFERTFSRWILSILIIVNKVASKGRVFQLSEIPVNGDKKLSAEKKKNSDILTATRTAESSFWGP